MVSTVSAPTRLRVPDLLCAVDRAADDVLSRHNDHVVPAGGAPPDDRWSPGSTATRSWTSG